MTKVLLISSDVIGSSMAGPGIRYWELAKALAPHFEVTLLTPNACDLVPEGLKIASQQDLKKEIQRSDVLLCQRLNARVALWVALYRPKLIIDAYDPEPLEHLEIFKNRPLPARRRHHYRIVELIRYSLTEADGILSANELQKDLWLGFLLGQGLPTPELYDEDTSLEHYLVEVPFGLPVEPPERGEESIRKKFGIGPDETLLLWGGGIWNWFDPLTLIRAVKRMEEAGEPVKLIFMGVRHPNENVPEMEMTQKAVQLARELNLLDKEVFFNFGWVPYRERQAFLKAADIGVSTHFKHLETRYSFRTRMLDYLWAGLPVICTEGDYFAKKFTEEAVGIAVPYGDPEAICEAIRKIRSTPPFYRAHSAKVAAEYTWPAVAAPLIGQIKWLMTRPVKKGVVRRLWNLIRCGFKVKVASLWQK